jgi:ubiquinone/menaquinone biosynthesis C-methylase UbiE
LERCLSGRKETLGERSYEKSYRGFESHSLRHIMTKQEYYRQKYSEIEPTWMEGTKIYKELIFRLVDKDTYILDVGCGHSELLSDIYSKTDHTYGIDPDPNALNRNTNIKNIERAYVEKMPFENNFFDVIVLAWVLEHLSDPAKAFSEIHRVLKPGGSVIFITPNTYNYNVWIIRLIPEKFHDFFTKKLYQRQENDTFSKKYRINSIKRIDEILSKIGFKKEYLITNGDPSYISFNNLTFKIAILLEKILNKKPFKKCRVHIIGQYIKV